MQRVTLVLAFTVSQAICIMLLHVVFILVTPLRGSHYYDPGFPDEKAEVERKESLLKTSEGYQSSPRPPVQNPLRLTLSCDRLGNRLRGNTI